MRKVEFGKVFTAHGHEKFRQINKAIEKLDKDNAEVDHEVKTVEESFGSTRPPQVSLIKKKSEFKRLTKSQV